MAKLKPNDKCYCGSGRKYKKCCQRRDTTGFDERDLIAPGPVPQHVKNATDRMMAEEGYTAEVSAKLLAAAESRRRPRRTDFRAAMALAMFAHGLHGSEGV